MAGTCNTCGAFEGIETCSYCSTLVCKSCKLQHEPYCKQIQKMKARGEGPTIANAPQGEHRRGHEQPVDTTRQVTKFTVLSAPYDFNEPQPEFDETEGGLRAVAAKLAAPVESIAPAVLVDPIAIALGLAILADDAPVSLVHDVDQAIEAVKDLLG